MGKLSLMLSSSPAEVSGSSPGLSPLACPAVTWPQGAPGLTQPAGSPYMREVIRVSMQSSSRKTTMPDSSLTDVPVGSTALEEAHLGDQHHLPCSSQFSFWLLSTALSWLEQTRLLSPRSQCNLVLGNLWNGLSGEICCDEQHRGMFPEAAWMERQKASLHTFQAFSLCSFRSENVCLSILPITLTTI